MLKGVLSISVFRLHLVMFCAIITNIWWAISNSYMARGKPAFLWIIIIIIVIIIIIIIITLFSVDFHISITI